MDGRTVGRTQELDVEFEVVYSVTFSADDAYIAAALSNGCIRIFSTKSAECVKVLRHHKSAALSVSFSPDSLYLASSSADQPFRSGSITSARAADSDHEERLVWYEGVSRRADSVRRSHLRGQRSQAPRRTAAAP